MPFLTLDPVVSGHELVENALDRDHFEDWARDVSDLFNSLHAGPVSLASGSFVESPLYTYTDNSSFALCQMGHREILRLPLKLGVMRIELHELGRHRALILDLLCCAVFHCLVPEQCHANLSRVYVELFVEIVLRAHFLYGLYDLFVLWFVDKAYQRVHFGVDRVLQQDRCQQVDEVGVLFVLQAYFHVQHVESDHRIVDEAHEIFDLFHDSVEQTPLLLSVRLVALAALGLFHVLLVILEELHSPADGGLTLLEEFKQYLSEELDQLDQRVVRHVLQMLADGIELSFVFSCGCVDDTQAHNVVLEVLFCLLVLCGHDVAWGLAGLQRHLIADLELHLYNRSLIIFTDQSISSPCWTDFH